MDNNPSFDDLMDSLNSNNTQNNKVEAKELSYDYVISEVSLAYEKLKRQVAGFCTREEQQVVINACSKAILNKENLIAQAGTGTGKTYAYLLSALPFIKEANIPLIISTHTVALQSQLFEKDIPTLLNAVAPDVSFEVAKGSNRYLCPLKAERLIENHSIDANEPPIDDLFGFDMPKSMNTLTGQDIELAQYILTDYLSGAFTGDLDTVKHTNTQRIVSFINRDHKSCNKRHCKYKLNCPFYKQKDRIVAADIVITNHAYLSKASNADSLESTVLSRLPDAILVIDEAHHFNDVYRDGTENYIAQSTAEDVLTLASNLQKSLVKLKAMPTFKSVACDYNFVKEIETVVKQSGSYFEILTELGEHLQLNFKQYRGAKKSFLDNESQWNLNFDTVGDFLQSKLTELLTVCTSALQSLRNISLKYAVKIHELADNKTEINTTSQWQTLIIKLMYEFSEAGACVARFVKFETLSQYEQLNGECVRWIYFDAKKYDIELHSNSANIAKTFQENIAGKVKALILTSATIESLNSFEFFKAQLGYTNKIAQPSLISVGSPFDYSKVDVKTPVLLGNPNSDHHCTTIILNLKTIINNHKAVLVLFCSNKQMQATYQQCAPALQSNILVQHDHTKSELISLHKANIDTNKHSILFGVDGLSEGIDLQGKYLTCVVITKLPFPNLSSPIMQYESKALEAKGGNSFTKIILPLCSRKLIQSAGRLIRTEKDHGEIYILDPRINHKRYGNELLYSLPMMQTNNAII